MTRFILSYLYMRLRDSGHVGAVQYAHNQCAIARKNKARRMAIRGRVW